jgi:hypothetical protein
MRRVALSWALLGWAILTGVIPAALRAQVPSPEAYFGHAMGADRTVLDWSRVTGYFRQLDENSDLISVREYGKSTEARPMIVAIISSAATLRDLDRYRNIQTRLADPRRTNEEEAQRLIAQGKPVVMITCSIHATEIASTHAAIEFAHTLITEAQHSPKIRTILGNVILLLVPSLNPDGLDLVTKWYRSTMGTPYEGTSPPWLYQKYVGHDNNRDWYFFTQAENRATISALHNVWRPQVVYDVHQMGSAAARMFVPPWLDPFDPNVDPLNMQLSNAMGMGMALDLTAAGKKGVVVNAMYDFWTPGRHYQAYHGGIRLLSEAASVRIASPVQITPKQLDRESRGYNPAVQSWNHVEPWRGGEWRLRDIVDYQLITFESCLYQAALRREDLLQIFYRLGKRAVERTSPYAFVIPEQQRDPAATRKLLETLHFGMVEIEKATGAFSAGGRSYPSGTYLVKLQQPYGAFAKTLLERQRYPDLRQYPGGPPQAPYDVTAHTLPLLLGVAVETIEAPFTVTSKLVRSFDTPRSVAGDNGRWPAADSASWVAVNRTWQEGGNVWRDSATGDFYTSNPRAQANLREVQRPRIGLYKSFIPSMDEGWTRWVLEQFRFAYSSLENPEILAGDLRSKYDVIVFPSQSASSIASGYRKGSMPGQFTGGLDVRGAQSLREFTNSGGTLIFLNDSNDYVTRLGIDVPNVVRGLSRQQFYCPGSLLRVSLDPTHPLAAGLPAEATIWMEDSPVWDPHGLQNVRPVARYTSSGVLASGWLLGSGQVEGRSALLEVKQGKGRMLLFGFRPQYRGQSYSTFKLLFNGLLYF